MSAGDERRPPPADLVGELAELEVAREELQVAEEELRVQQQEIARLVSRVDRERRWQEHVAAVLPVGLFVTDGTGQVLEANPAMAALVGVALPRLGGKPLSVYLDPEDVRGLRWALRALGAGRSADYRAPVTIRGRGAAVTGQLFGAPDVVHADAGRARIRWVLVTDEHGLPPAGPGEQEAARPAGTGPPGDGAPVSVAEALTQLTRLAGTDADRRQLLLRMSVLAQRAVPAADWVSVTVGRPAAPRAIGSDSAAAQDVDGRQLRTEEGPCRDAAALQEVVVTGDLRADPRWPALARIAAAGPVRGVLAVPLAVSGEPTGVLNVYAAAAEAFTEADRRIAELVATAIAAVLDEAAERESLRRLTLNLEQALASRAVIDQAKGVLMARLHVGADEAFARLVTLSNRLNVKVRDLAHLVVEGHADEVIAAGS
ncbi:ANTAR domain-containing protein [Geodermatophilus sp. FMUSA9-8]|uniref:ANTAR domain-containing protein n=1 Tax=Geodermatophilus sp. FMUSA9-8 TaxID=3120155 RepID=UPI00300B811C